MAHTMLARARPANGHSTPDPLSFAVPARHNPRLKALAEQLSADEELRQLWRCANTIAVDRLDLGDNGEVHARIVANAALKLLRLLREAGAVPGLADHYRLPPDDAEVVVVLAAALHVLSLAVEAEPASGGGLALAALKARELLAGLYPARERAIVLSETLHAISALPAERTCLTLEAGVLKVADTLDMTKGRVRLGPDAGAARADAAVRVQEVLIQKHHDPPVRVVIALDAATGALPVEALLRERLRLARLEGRVGFAARAGSGMGMAWLPLDVWPATR